jgi:hypothetical protein
VLLGYFVHDSTVFVLDGQLYRKAKAVLLPSLQNLERHAIPEITTLVSRIALIVTSHGA